MAAALSYRNKNSDSSDSDSEDSDKECLNWKRVTKNDDEDLEKIPIVPPAEPQINQAPNPLKRKRNNIWCEVLEDQMMSETLTFCGIKNKPKGFGSRGAESYDFTLGKKFYNDDGSDENMSDDSRTHYPNRHKRFKNDYFGIDAAGQEAAEKIIKILAEPKRYLIFRIVKYLGTEKALKLLKMTEDIEENGGMMIKNQERRRTPGGVYLNLLRSDESIEKETLDKIFEGELNSYEQKRKYDDIRRKKKRKKSGKKKKKNSKDRMEVENSSLDNSKDSDDGNMEEDDNIKDTPDIAADDTPNPISSGKTSDLEEGEVE